MEGGFELAGGVIFKHSVLELEGGNTVGANGYQPGRTPPNDQTPFTWPPHAST